MAKNRKQYSPELVEEILSYIENGQTISYACQEVGINRSTFTKWLSRYPDFKVEYEKAQEVFRQKAPEELKRSAENRIIDLINNGHKIIRAKKINEKITHKRPIYEGDQIVGYKVVWQQSKEGVEEEVTTMPTPEWAINRVLPKVVDLESAIKLIEAHGLKTVVADVETFREWLIATTKDTGENSQGGSGKGISEELANEIRARILGVSENAPDSPALPTEMGEG